MIYSFDIVIDEDTAEYDISNLRENDRNILEFPTHGVDAEYIDRDTNCYRIYFDDDVDIDVNVAIIKIINEVKIMLRYEKIKKINESLEQKNIIIKTKTIT